MKVFIIFDFSLQIAFSWKTLVELWPRKPLNYLECAIHQTVKSHERAEL